MTKRALVGLLIAVLAATPALTPATAQAEPPDCSDAIDNDADGYTDFPADPDCQDATDNTESPPPPQCSDALDNDADGHVDYPDDWDCLSAADASEGVQCRDGADNDGDGSVDYPDDPECGSTEDDSESDVSSPPWFHLTIRYDSDANRFRGRLDAARRLCIGDRPVKVKKVRPGRNQVIGRDRTSRTGHWGVPYDGPRGRFYAVAPQRPRRNSEGNWVRCDPNRSVTIRIR